MNCSGCFVDESISQSMERIYSVNLNVLYRTYCADQRQRETFCFKTQIQPKKFWSMFFTSKSLKEALNK